MECSAAFLLRFAVSADRLRARRLLWIHAFSLSADLSNS
jgi:hypothetical protein